MRNGSIISNVRLGDDVINDQDKVNLLHRTTLQKLCAGTLTRSEKFPHLEPLIVNELRDIVI